MTTKVKQQRQRLRLRVTGLGRMGEGLAICDGKPVFVFGAIPGEEVVVEVVRERRRYTFAQVVEVLEPSPDRVEPPCPYFGPCTGCQWQHVRYEAQLEEKRRTVAETLERVGGLAGAPVTPTLPAPEQYGYRNHARFSVARDGSLGFVHRESRQPVRIDRCLLMHPWINHALDSLQDRCQETTQVSVRYGVRTGESLIQPMLKSPAIPLASGQKWYREVLGGHTFRVSSPAFFQVNTAQAERLASLVVERLRLTGAEVVVDGYAGVGTFAALLSPLCRRVIAIEESSAAAQDALCNLEGMASVELVQGKTEEVLGQLSETPHAVVLDPSRVGCHPGALAALCRLAPSRLVYVSCDPESLARDLRVLTDGPFRLEEVQPVDMFPQTHHVECLATLALDQDKRGRLESRRVGMVLASSSPRRREILAEVGLEFRVVPPPPEEELAAPGEGPAQMAEQRALAKAQAVARGLARGAVIGADTVVVDGEEVLGKPASPEEAVAMLRRLRGREHSVITGVAVVDAATGEYVVGHRSTSVTMRKYGDDEVAEYVARGEALDKAGAYAVQDPMLRPATTVRGCYLNVVGLPVCTLLRLLERMGVPQQPVRHWTPQGECPDCRRLAGTRGRS